MKEKEIKLIEKLTEKAGYYSWYGWKHRHYKNGSKMVSGSIYRISAMTIIPELFIRVVIRFCYTIPHFSKSQEFDGSHENWHEFFLTDELCKSGTKKLIVLNGKEDEICEKKLKEFFNKARSKARFNNSNKERKLNLNKIADSL